MRPVAFIAAIAGVAVLGSAIVLGGGRLARQGAVGVEQFEIDDADLETEGISQRETILPGRPVAPEAIAPLERVEPRQPLGDLALAVPPKPGVPEPTLLHQPIATAAGRIESQGHTVEIEGIAVVEAEETCASGGDAWPCGMIARTAFRNWLRGRAVECTVGEPPAREPVISACTLGEKDVAEWLVENGYATAGDGSAHAEAGERAKRERRGIFGPGPSQKP